MDMVDRVAAAMEAALRDDKTLIVYVGSPGETVLVDGDVDFRLLARAAIAAMRAPNEKMVKAGIGALAVADYGMPEYGPEDAAEMTFSAMIDAALTSSEPQAPSSG